MVPTAAAAVESGRICGVNTRSPMAATTRPPLPAARRMLARRSMSGAACSDGAPRNFRELAVRARTPKIVFFEI